MTITLTLGMGSGELLELMPTLTVDGGIYNCDLINDMISSSSNQVQSSNQVKLASPRLCNAVLLQRSSCAYSIHPTTTPTFGASTHSEPV